VKELADRAPLAGLRSALADPAFSRSFGYYGLFVCLGLDLGVLGPTLPALAAQTNASLGVMGLLFLCGSAGSAAGTAASGWFFDRLRGHAVLGVAALCQAALIATMPLAPSFPVLAAIVVVKGASQGFINTGGNALLVWTHGDRSGPYMNALHFFFGLGAFLAPLVVAQLIAFPGGYRVAYWVLAAFVALNGLRMLTAGGSPRPERAAAAGAGTRAAAAGGRPTPYGFVIAAALFLFFYVGAEISFGGWVYTYAVSLRLATPAGAAYLNSAFWMAFTAGRLLSIPLATRFRPLQVVPAAVLGCLGFLALVLLLPASGAALWAAAIGLGFCMAPVWPTGFTLAGQSVRLSGRLISLILLGDAFGGMALPSTIGKVIEAAGPRSMVPLIIGSLALTLLALAGMLKLRPRPAGSRPGDSAA
jgi:FHS family Na+ dependent glucose MFS transporter 1